MFTHHVPPQVIFISVTCYLLRLLKGRYVYTLCLLDVVLLTVLGWMGTVCFPCPVGHTETKCTDSQFIQEVDGLAFCYP